MKNSKGHIYKTYRLSGLLELRFGS